jgi:bifunctional pyridoxal-dependent enzyme with beta-cystathionase and maltose regulon repressor activities
MKKEETPKKQVNNSELRKELAELKLTVEIVKRQVEKLSSILSIVQPVQPVQPIYTEEELHEIAEYRKRKQ